MVTNGISLSRTGIRKTMQSHPSLRSTRGRSSISDKSFKKSSGSPNLAFKLVNSSGVGVSILTQHPGVHSFVIEKSSEYFRYVVINVVYIQDYKFTKLGILIETAKTIIYSAQYLIYLVQIFNRLYHNETYEAQSMVTTQEDGKISITMTFKKMTVFKNNFVLFAH